MNTTRSQRGRGREERRGEREERIGERGEGGEERERERVGIQPGARGEREKETGIKAGDALMGLQQHALINVIACYIGDEVLRRHTQNTGQNRDYTNSLNTTTTTTTTT